MVHFVSNDAGRISITEYATTIFVGRSGIYLSQNSADEMWRQVALNVDGQEVGIMRLPGWFLPSIAVGSRHALILGQTECYVLNLATRTLRAFEQQYPIHEAYIVGDFCFLVLELSVLIVDLDRCVILDTVFDHDEIILWSWWDDERLYVKNLQHRQYAFRLSDDGSTLERIEPDSSTRATREVEH